MKKIPTLFERIFEENNIVGIRDNVYPGMEWVRSNNKFAVSKR